MHRMNQMMRRMNRTMAASARRRGSAVLLVVVSLVLMVLIGTAYLQQTRVQRFAVTTAEGCQDRVILSILDQISNTIARDLEERNHETDGFSLHDYPWTNPGTFGRTANQYDGSTPPVHGNFRDRSWLAPHSPVYTGPGDTDPSWGKITNLTGLFLDYNRETNTFGISDDVPAEHLVDNTGDANHRDTNLQVNINDNPAGFLQLVDATGDGIPDSRWTWAPIRECGGITYLMAAYITDLSGLINVNTALNSGLFDTSPAGGDAPHWHLPTELDLGGLVYEMDNTGDGPTNLNEGMLAYRLGVTSPGTPPVSRADRDSFWQNQGRYFTQQSNDYRRYGLSNEYELRHRFGLNSLATPALLAESTGLGAFLRDDEGDERRYDNVNWSLYNNTGSATDHYNFYHREPRKLMTTMSGAMPFVWPVSDTQNFNRGGSKQNLNGSADAIAGVIEDAFAGVLQNDLPARSPVNEFPHQFAANIAAYADGDSKLNVVSDGSNDYFGFEALPLITDVYVQAEYEGVAALPASGDPVADGWDITWTQQPRPGYAIEVRNAFRHPIDLTTVHLVVEGVDWGTLADLTEKGENDSTRLETLAPDHVLIFYRNSGSGGSGSNDDLESFLTEESGYTNIERRFALNDTDVHWPDGEASSTTGSETVQVELQATLDDDDEAADWDWPYWIADAVTLPDKYIQEGVAPGATPPAGFEDPGTPVEQYWQYVNSGDGRGLNVLAIGGDDFEDDEAPVAYNRTDTHLPDMIVLGEADKGNGAYHVDLEEQQVLVGNRGVIRQVGELAHITALAMYVPTAVNPAGQTMATAWAAGIDDPANPDVRDLMLDFWPASGSLVTTDDNDYRVTHAAMLIDQFTTLSPAEQNTVPGLLNVNTAPQHLLEKVLPLPDPWLRQEVARRIVAYREASQADRVTMLNSDYALPGADPVTSDDVRANPGIAHIGELYPLLQDLLVEDHTGDGGPNLTDDTDAIDEDGTNTIRVDFLTNPAADEADGIANDREEEAMLFTFLSQVLTTRSDFFAAYVIVRGYDANSNFTATDVLEQTRFIAIFQRELDSGEVRVVAVLPGERPYEVR
ncbi:MAG: hypothetical protein WD534_16800 [Phycisphaeraceae bacterium]